MDQLTQSALQLGSQNVVVMTAEDFDRTWAIVHRAAEEGYLTDEEHLAMSLVTTSNWTCPGAVKAIV